MNTARLAQMIREDAAAIPDDECITGCGRNRMAEYPTCAICAHNTHFAYVICRCDQCTGAAPTAEAPETTKEPKTTKRKGKRREIE